MTFIRFYFYFTFVLVFEDLASWLVNKRFYEAQLPRRRQGQNMGAKV